MRPQPPAASALAALLLSPLLGGCAPGTPNAESWRFDAIKAVGDVSSSVSSVQLALSHDHDLFAPYVRTVAVESEETAGKAASKLSALQPPAAYRKPYDDVTADLDDADSLLAEARIAVVQHDLAAYPGLVSRLSEVAYHLSDLQGRLRALASDRSWQ